MILLCILVSMFLETPLGYAEGDNALEIQIKRLKSPRLVDRLNAVETLVKMDEIAQPALLRLVESSDLELKGMGARVLDRIEGKHLAEPRKITLDFINRPLKEVVDSISERTQEGLSLQINNDLKRGEEIISLTNKEQISFWEAVEQLEKAGKLQIDFTGSNNFNRNAMMLGNLNVMRPWRPSYSVRDVVLIPGEFSKAIPRNRWGRFEIFIANIHLQRDRILGASDGRQPLESVSSKFDVKLRVLPEPNLLISTFGKVTLLQAIDDLGQSLIYEASSQGNSSTQAEMALMLGQGQANGASILPISLHYPDRPGRSIQVLKGEVEAVVMGAKRDPIVASLVSPFDKPVYQSGISLTIHDVKNGGIGTVRLVDITLTRPDGIGQFNNGMATFQKTANVVPPGAQGWLLFMDSKGRCVDRVATTPYNLTDGQRRTIQFNQPSGSEPAVTVRYLSPSWTTLRIPFEFHDIPMP